MTSVFCAGADGSPGEDGHLRGDVGHQGGAVQVLPGEPQRRPLTQRTPRLLPQGQWVIGQGHAIFLLSLLWGRFPYCSLFPPCRCVISTLVSLTIICLSIDLSMCHLHWSV